MPWLGQSGLIELACLHWAPCCCCRDRIGAGGETAATGYLLLQRLLSSFVLRRTKTSTINGEPIVQVGWPWPPAKMWVDG